MKKQKEKTKKHCVIFRCMKIMNTETEETQWLCLNGESQEIKIVPSRGEYVLTTTPPRIGSDCKNQEKAYKKCEKAFNRSFADLYLKVVESC